jgi:hypothetical protein
MSGQLSDPAALYPRRKPRLVEQEPGWAPEAVWILWGRENSVARASNGTAIPRTLVRCLVYGDVNGLNIPLQYESAIIQFKHLLPSPAEIRNYADCWRWMVQSERSVRSSMR